MDIAICIKHVPVSNDVSVDPVTHSLIRENTEGMINPADLNAIEEALVLRDKTGGRAVVFTMGPPDAEKSLRDAMAMGCDEAVLVCDRAFAGADTVATARTLASAIERFASFDLILAGAASSDGATGQVGPMIAEYLGLPHIADARSIEACDNGAGVEAEKKMAGFVVRLSAELPALVCVACGCNTPRLATLRAKMAAKKKPLSVCGNGELNLPLDVVGRDGSPTDVVDSFERPLARRAEFLSGGACEIAGQIMALIEQEMGG